MAMTVQTNKYNNNIGKFYRGLEIISWERSHDNKNIIYTLKDPQTGELYKKQHSNIYKEIEEIELKQNFKLSELKPGMIVETKNNKKCLVTDKNLFDLENGTILTIMDYYNESLNHKFSKDLIINKVFDNVMTMNLLYKRPLYKLTDRERKFLEAAKLLNFKYIFKNKQGDIYVSNRNPNKGAIDWVFTGPVFLTRLVITSKDFEFIKWSSEEATPIDTLI